MARGRRGSGARGNRGRKSSSRSSRSTSSRSSRSKNTRGSGSKANRGRTTRSKTTTKKKSTPTSRRTTQQRTNQRGVGTKKTAATGVKNAVKKAVSVAKSTVGRITRPQSAVASTRRNTVTTTRNQAFNNQLKNIQAASNPSFGPVADGATYARNITNYGMKFGSTPEARAKAYEQSLSGRKGLFDNATSGSGPVASGDAYARGLETSRFGSPMNAAKTVLNTIPGVNFRLQNDKELADSVGRAPNLTRRRRGGGGGVSRIEQQAAMAQMQPETAPTIGQPIEETGAAPMDNSELTRIQSQAYNTQLTSSLVDMFGGQGSVGYVPQGDAALSPTLQAGKSRGRRRVRMFGARRKRGGTGDQFSRAGDRIAKLTNINI